jgi:uncharacterized membrane protein SpoIIM required for sporulation
LDERTPSVSDAASAARRVLYDLPTAVLPAYLLALGTASVARAPLLLAVGTAVALLAATGRIEPVLEAAAPLLEERGGAVDTGPGAPVPELPPELETAIDGLAVPEVGVLLLAGGAVSVIVLVLARGVASAVTQTTVWATLAVGNEPSGPGGERDPAHRALTAGVRGAGRWQTFAGLFLLKSLLGVVFVGGPVVLAFSSAATQPAGVLVGILLALVGVLVTLVALGLLAFAGPAVVVDDHGVFGAVRASLGVFRHQLGTALGFLFLVVALYVGAGVVAGVLGAVGAARLGALITPLFVAPFADVLATAVYAGARTEPGTAVDESVAQTTRGDEPTTGGDAVTARDSDESDTRGDEMAARDDQTAARDDQTAARDDQTATRGDQTAGTGVDPVGSRPEAVGTTDHTTPGVTVPVRDRAGVGERLRQAFAGGLRAFGEFALAAPAAVAGALVVFVLGLAGGWAVTAPAGVAVPAPSDVGNVFGALPVNDFVNIAANNWLVAAGGVYSGLAFGVPAAVGAAFNGAIVGALAGAFDLRALLALVVPHGVIEIPVLLVTWGLGLHLAGVGWRAVRGETDAATVARRLREAAHVLGGAAVLLVVAALVEAFLTPEIAALVL